MAAFFGLVHSPLVGPATWSWVADELQRCGHRVVVPSLRASVAGSWRACVDAVVHEVADEEHAVLVGHSGAGALLPVIAHRMARPPVRLVFVDAHVPPTNGDAPLLPVQFLDTVRALARDGLLPKWSEWFGRGMLETLVPDAARRSAVWAELPELPLSFLEGRVPMPTGWTRTDGAYILLSDPYRPDAAEAASRGWPVIELPGTHLDIVTRSAEVSDAILDVTGRNPGDLG